MSSEEHYPSNSGNEDFDAIVKGLEVEDVDIGEYFEEGIPIEAKLLGDRVEKLPRIDFEMMTNNWLEVQGNTRRYALFGLGKTALGMLCEMTHHETGETEFVMLQGSYVIEGVLDDSEALSQGHPYFESGSFEEETAPQLLSIANEEGGVDSVVLCDRQAVLRDAYIQVRPVYTLDEYCRVIPNMQPIDEPRPFYSLPFYMPSGDKKIFMVDVGTLILERIHRARLIRESDASVVTAFGRADAPAWQHYGTTS